MKFRIVAVCLLLCAFVQAQKEAPLPKDLPPYGAQTAFQPPEVKASRLGNGLTLWLVSEPGLPLCHSAWSCAVDLQLIPLTGKGYPT